MSRAVIGGRERWFSLVHFSHPETDRVSAVRDQCAPEAGSVLARQVCRAFGRGGGVSALTYPEGNETGRTRHN
ncbi:hypothetical protein C1N81_44345 [Streptomyces sp. SGAir0957]